MSTLEEKHISRREVWITRISFFIFALIISSIGPILSLTDTIYQYQQLVYRYDTYQDIPGLPEIHVINVDLDMIRNGNVSMQCKGPNLLYSTLLISQDPSLSRIHHSANRFLN
jgi:hypothetical protein